MKKVLALVLAILTIASMSVVVFADVTASADSMTQATLVTYGVSQEYVVVIPASIDLVEATESVDGKEKGWVYDMKTIAVKDVVIAGDEQIKIQVNSTDAYKDDPSASAYITKSAWQLVDTKGKSAKVDYSLSLAGFSTSTVTQAAVANDGVVLAQYRQTGNAGTQGAEQSVALYFSSKGTAQEGTYRDRLTFKVSVVTSDATATTLPTA